MLLHKHHSWLLNAVLVVETLTCHLELWFFAKLFVKLCTLLILRSFTVIHASTCALFSNTLSRMCVSTSLPSAIHNSAFVLMILLCQQHHLLYSNLRPLHRPQVSHLQKNWFALHSSKLGANYHDLFRPNTVGFATVRAEIWYEWHGLSPLQNEIGHLQNLRHPQRLKLHAWKGPSQWQWISTMFAIPAPNDVTTWSSLIFPTLGETDQYKTLRIAFLCFLRARFKVECQDF